MRLVAAISVILSILVAGGIVSAQEKPGVLSDLTPSQARDVLNNFGSESVECLVYFTMAREGLRRGEKDTSGIDAVIDRLTEESSQLMDKEVFAARIKLYWEDLAESQMKNDLSRISVLTAKYGDVCKEHLDHPDRRLIHWAAKKGYIR